MGTQRTAGPGLRIGEVARRTGMTIAALRAWETRYGLLAPERSAGGQRRYREADITRVRAVRHLVAEGWSVAGAADQVLGQPGGPGGAAGRPLLDALAAVDACAVVAGQVLGQPGGPGGAAGRPSARTGEGEGLGGPAALGLLLPGRQGRPLLDALAAVDACAVVAAYEAVRDMLRAGSPAEVRDALVSLVKRLGGQVGEAAEQDDTVMPVDLAFGEGPPLLPRAPAASVARMRLEAVLPLAVEDARVLVHRLQLSARAYTSGDDGAQC